MKNAYQRRVLCEIYQELPSRLSGSEVKLLSFENKTIKNYYEFNYFIDEYSSIWKKINFWASIITLSIIPLGTNVTMNLNVKEIKAGKPVRESSFSSERLILGGILIAPLYPFSDGVKGVTENHTRLLDGFVRWY